MTQLEMKQLIECLSLLNIYFEGNSDKVASWMTIKNPMLGEIEPITFFWLSRGHKVLSFIKNSLEENKPA